MPDDPVLWLASELSKRGKPELAQRARDLFAEFEATTELHREATKRHLENKAALDELLHDASRELPDLIPPELFVARSSR